MNEKLYRVNEIFYSLQGEGRWAGRPAVFIRFSGCNLKCPFCDTDFASHKDMALYEIIDAIRPWRGCKFVVLTGGEPTLQADRALIDALHGAGFYISMETNGTREGVEGVDWITVSPKTAYVENGQVIVHRANEVKVVYDGKHSPSSFGIMAEEYYIQPCDTGFIATNREINKKCVEWVKAHPQWRLSIQQQKILNVR